MPLALESAAEDAIIIPQSPILLFTVLLQPGMMMLAYLVGRLTRRILQRWGTSLSSSAATLTALLGLWGGLALGAWLFDEDYLWATRMLICAVATAVGVIVLTSAVAAWLQHEPELEPIAEAARRGESERLEFKSSARVNLRTGKRDDAMETIAAKTVAAFLNSRGGTLRPGPGLHDPAPRGCRPLRALPARPVAHPPGSERRSAAAPGFRPGRRRRGRRLPSHRAALAGARLPVRPQGQGRARAVGAGRQLHPAPRGR